MIIKIILKLCSIFGSSGSANQSLGNLPARQSIFATSLLITLCGSPHAAVDPASGWNITWSSTVTGGGEEDIGEFHSESSISGQLSGGYLLDVLEETLVLDGSLTGNFISRDYSGGTTVCGQGDTLGEAFVFTENTTTTSMTGSANDAIVTIYEIEQASGINTVNFNIGGQYNYTTTDQTTQQYLVQNCITDIYTQTDTYSGVSGTLPSYLLHGGELVAEDEKNLIFKGSFTSTEYDARYLGPVTRTLEAHAEKITASVVRSLEVNQVIQDLYNSVPLVEDKATWVRATIESPVLRHVRAVLRGFDALGKELPESPLSAINVSGGVYAKSDNSTRRSQLNSTLNFRLPLSWTWSSHGGTELLLEPLQNQHVLCAGNCGVFRTFNPVAELDVKFIRVKHITNTGVTQPSGQDIRIIKQRIKDIMPISSLRHLLTSEVTLTGHPGNNRLIQKLGHMWVRNAALQPSQSKTMYHGVIYGDYGGAGLTPGKISWGKFLPAGSMSYGRYTNAHEISHNLGLHHTVNDDWIERSYFGGVERMRGPCDSSAPKDAINFPFIFDLDGFPPDKFPPSTDLRAAIGPMAVDSNDPSTVDPKELIYGISNYPPILEPQLSQSRFPSIIDPYKHFALMSYCGPGFRWVSRDNYISLMSNINDSISGTLSPTSLDAENDYLLVHGNINYINETLELEPVTRLSATVQPPQPEPGEFILGWLDETGNIIGTISFSTQPAWPDAPMIETGIEHFFIAIPADPAIRQLAVVHESAPDTILASINATTHPPTVEILVPNGGEVLAGEEAQISWTGVDPDDDILTYLIQFSADNGATWRTLDTGLTDTTYTIDMDQLEGTSTGLFYVQASDGLLTSSDQSDAVFTIAPRPPSVYIVEPGDGAVFFEKQLVHLEAEAEDADDGQLNGANIQWVSSLDGPLGTGERLISSADELSAGNHLITVTATDSDSNTSTDSVNLVIRRDAVNADLSLTVETPQGDTLPLGEQGTYRITITSSGPEDAEALFIEASLGDGLVLISATPDKGNCTAQTRHIECSIDILSPSSSTTIELLIEAISIGTAPFEALVISDAFDSNLEDNQTSQSIEIVPQIILGDLDDDGDVDARDRAILRSSLGACSDHPRFTSQADYNNNGCIDYSDYRIWYRSYKLYLN